MDLLEHNRKAWNSEVTKGNRWTVPASAKEIAAARQGDVTIVLTPYKPVPADWLGELAGADVLCLASGGGQQGPILAAAGACVTVLDNSDEQLACDIRLSEEYDLGIRTVRGNMQDLSMLSDTSFDLIVHPVSNCFIDDILPVWREAYRVLRPSGRLLSGFCNPLLYLLDWDQVDSGGDLVLRYAIPYSDLDVLSPEQLAQRVQENQPLEFGHSLEDQIQGQIAAGFSIIGFYEDKGEPELDALSSSFIATCALKE